jgi:glycosyltransferase involved in cell wall biosynthesis
MQEPARTWIVTIVARNYLALAATLLASVRAVMPEAGRCVFVLDDLFAEETLSEGEILRPGDVFAHEAYLNLAHRYDITELATAVKPFVIKHLLGRGASRVFYFDPDIEVFATPFPVIDALDEADVALTPHTTEPIPLDGELPSEITLLRAGAYNLGFIGVRASAATSAMLEWWCERLERLCVNDVGAGLFVDQKWIDLVPGLVEKVAIVRHRGCNVGYWNLHSRKLDPADPHRLVDGTPLIFFHYSGYDVREPSRLSTHQSRIVLEHEPGLSELLNEYSRRVLSRGHLERLKIGYGFRTFSNDVPLDSCSRGTLRDASAYGLTFPNPADVDAQPSAWAYLNEPLESRAPGPVITRYLACLATFRPDLRSVFPDVLGRDRERYVDWLRNDPRTGIPPAYLAAAGIRGRSGGRSPAASDAGVTVAGYFRTESGVGEAGRSHVAALRNAGVPARLVDFSAYAPSRGGDTSLFVPAGDVAGGNFPVNLVCVNADCVSLFRDAVGPAFFDGHYNIGSWWWELPEFPDRWLDAFAPFDEIWVGTQFIASAVGRKSPVPVVVVPPIVNVGRVRPVPRAAFGLADDETTFLFMFDFLSVFERKNPLGALAAFRRAFPGDERVRLVLKCINAEFDLPARERLAAAVANDPRVTVMDRYLSREEKNQLLAACDAYVSLHRSEGFGYTPAEAMALGRPVIATAWSGNVDYMTASNSYGIGYRLVPVGTAVGPYEATQVWADPDLGAAAEAMRDVFERPQHARLLGERGRADIRERFSAAAVGKIAAGRIELIESRRLAVAGSLAG